MWSSPFRNHVFEGWEIFEICHFSFRLILSRLSDFSMLTLTNIFMLITFLLCIFRYIFSSSLRCLVKLMQFVVESMNKIFFQFSRKVWNIALSLSQIPYFHFPGVQKNKFQLLVLSVEDDLIWSRKIWKEPENQVNKMEEKSKKIGRPRKILKYLKEKNIGSFRTNQGVERKS